MDISIYVRLLSFLHLAPQVGKPVRDHVCLAASLVGQGVREMGR